ncbi:hypothetical protein D3C87_1071000 [compost metagenome]
MCVTTNTIVVMINVKLNISSIFLPCSDAASGSNIAPCTVYSQYTPYKPNTKNKANKLACTLFQLMPTGLPCASRLNSYTLIDLPIIAMNKHTARKISI